MHSYAVLSESDPARLSALVVRDTLELLDASLVRAYMVDEAGAGIAEPTDRTSELALLPSALEMETALVRRALSSGRSLLSTHPELDPHLELLASRCARDGVTTQVLVVEAHETVYGAFAVHWLGRQRPEFEQRSVFYAYWEGVGLAFAAAAERARQEALVSELHARAYFDKLTGLPNAQSLEEQLEAHAKTFPFGVLALDFDGMREANTAFGFEEGGNVLIRMVAHELASLMRDRELPFRMHTAGDEFAVLLPGLADGAVETRADEIEQGLDDAAVPAKFRTLYQGASVGWAARTRDESSGQALGRAIEAMRARKLVRKSR
jgi:diguanylate cyclase (GGDEF)-like protein